MLKIYKVDASYGDPDYPHRDTTVAYGYFLSEQEALARMQEGMDEMMVKLVAKWDWCDARRKEDVQRLTTLQGQNDLTVAQQNEIARQIGVWSESYQRSTWEMTREGHSAWLEDDCNQYCASVFEIEVEGMDTLAAPDPASIDFDEPLPKEAEEFYCKAYALLK